ncbi:MAG: NAD-dependent epimerase/dehydratase family protein [Candidatus Aenigmarchaeota archaeon]|nr:NAD-dependent epimerase/dehydratase family protein [Candidatus Aenigmarchaeota archaeon]
MKSALITGGSGFLGLNLSIKLLEKGFEVTILDINEITDDIPEKVNYIKGDILDAKKVSSAIKGMDIVFHTAALVPISAAGKRFFEVNVEGTKNVADACLEHGARLVHISSSSVYDLDSGMPLTENSPIKKTKEGYEYSKYLADEYVQSLMEKGLEATIIRPRVILGPGRLGIFQILFEWLSEGKKIFIIGNGKNKFQMISVSDLCDACIISSENNEALGEIINIGTSNFRTLGEDLQELINYAKTGSKIVKVHPFIARIPLSILFNLKLSPIVPFHYKTMYKEFYFDISKAKKMLNWEPKDSNIKMLKESYEWYIKHKKTVDSNKGTTHKSSPRQKLLCLIKKLS